MFKEMTALTIPLFSVKLRSGLDFCQPVRRPQSQCICGVLGDPRRFTCPESGPCCLVIYLQSFPTLFLCSTTANTENIFSERCYFQFRLPSASLTTPFKMQMEEYFGKRLLQLLPLSDAFALPSSLLNKEPGIYKKT